MRIYLVLVLCLAGAACGRSIQEVEDLLQALREALAVETVDGTSELGRRTEGETETVKVNENGVVFAEQISFDDANSCETLHVPAHNGRLEVDIRHCFKEGKSMYCHSQESKCYLLSMEDEGEPGLAQQEEGIEKFENQNNPVLDANGIDVQANRWVITGVADRTKLPEALASFKPDFQVFFAAHMDEDAVILSDSGDETEENDKRQLIDGCPNGGIPRQMYAATNPAGCEYLVFCPRGDQGNADCPRRHVTDTFYMSCLCCPGDTRRQDCLFCNDLRCNFGGGGINCN